MTARITRLQIGAFVLPRLAFGMASAPFFYVLPTYYAQHTTASLAALGSTLVFTRLFDAVIDPLIGYLSDNTRTRWGARKPWVMAASLLLGIAIFFVFQPSPDDGIGFFLLWSTMFYLAWSLFDIPGDAWLAEVTGDYKQRSTISGLQGLALQAGGFTFFAMSATGLFDTGMSPALMAAIGWTTLIAIPLTAFLACALVPAGVPIVVTRRTSPRALLSALKGNGPLQIYLSSQLFGGLGGGIYLGTQLLLLDVYFQQGANFGLIFLIYQAAHFLAMPVWLRIVHRFGKHRSWAISWSISAAMAPLPVLFVTPGPDAFWYLAGFAIARSVVAGADMIVPRALMADAVDYGTLKTGANSAGSYFALASLAVSICAAVSSGVAFWLLDGFGFNPKPGAVNAPSAMNGLLFTAIVLPTLFNITAALLIWRFPIDARRAGIIRRRIETRPAAGPAATAFVSA
jgi:Na+/melibiose symporter-like transporter